MPGYGANGWGHVGHVGHSLECSHRYLKHHKTKIGHNTRATGEAGATELLLQAARLKMALDRASALDSSVVAFEYYAGMALVAS